MAWLDRLKDGLKGSRSELIVPITRALHRSNRVDAEAQAEIERILITSDVGVRTATEIVERLAAELRIQDTRREDILELLKGIIRERLAGCEKTLSLRTDGEPTVVLVTGVNGSGKTTTIAKLAAHLHDQDPSFAVTFAAADTFRAAAIEQLEVWAERIGADFIRHRSGADPSAVVFDAIDHARRRGGILFVDTAGRLQTNHNLMEELRKIERTVNKRLGRGSDERLLVLDATTGQNGISQAGRFHEAIRITGIVLTKLDGTAKGGVVLAIWETLKVPLMYVGVGEKKDDLHAFSADEFVEALFSA